MDDGVHEGGAPLFVLDRPGHPGAEPVPDALARGHGLEDRAHLGVRESLRAGDPRPQLGIPRGRPPGRGGVRVDRVVGIRGQGSLPRAERVRRVHPHALELREVRDDLPEPDRILQVPQGRGRAQGQEPGVVGLVGGVEAQLAGVGQEVRGPLHDHRELQAGRGLAVHLDLARGDPIAGLVPGEPIEGPDRGVEPFAGPSAGHGAWAEVIGQRGTIWGAGGARHGAIMDPGGVPRKALVSL